MKSKPHVIAQPTNLLRNMRPLSVVSWLICLLCSVNLMGQSFGAEFVDDIQFPHDAILLPSPFSPFLIGPYAGPDYTIHRGQFQMSENGIPCCTFEKGSGLGFTAGIKSFITLGEKSYLSPRVAYTRHNGSFESFTEEFPFFGADDTVENMRFRDELSAPIPTFAADLFYCYRIDSNLGLYIVGGPAIEYISSAEFSKTETIVGPDGLVYLNGGDSITGGSNVVRSVDIDYIDNVSRLVFGARAGLSLLYPLSETIYLNPEVTVSLPVTVIADNWRMLEVQGTFGVIFGL
ncbi:MAG: hypothetical protein KDD67_06990 [Ignavibacteriae bacterium]|nr:hypothetical protein [Ignavibacteriota bacterium]MCB9215222.1 hypothetical protein [Ignavibacteria bacterium]